MSFLSLAFLFALPLAAAPILLHLFDRRRSVMIEWGAMQFLAEAVRRRTNARRLQQWLLLLLRTLAVACLVLALARPLIHSRWLGIDDRRETILVIDNSLSMMRGNADESLFDAAVLSATGLLDEVPAGDTIRVLLTSPYPGWMTPAALKMNADLRSDLAAQLQQQTPTHGRSDLLAAFFTAVQAELPPGTKHRRIVVLTDGQRADWNTADEQSWRRLRDVLQRPPVPTELDVVNLGAKQAATSNLAVNQIDSNRTVVGVNQSFTVSAQIQNHGRTASAPCSLRWLVAGEELHRGQVPELAAGAVHEAVWKHSCSSLGVYALACEIETDDVLGADNRGTVIVEVVDRIPVLVIESDPAAAEFQRDAFFVQAALGWIDGESLDVQGVHVPTLVTPEQLDRTDLQPYRAVVIPNLTGLSEDVLRRLRAFVFDGGGLWIAAGPRTDVERFNQFLFADANGLAQLALDRIVDEPGTETQKTTIDRPVTAHPATSELADDDQLDTSQIVVSRRFRFAPPSPGEDVSVLLSLTTGEPLAIEKSVGRGRVIVQAVPLRLQWSELARSQAFVVIVQDWLDYLTEPQATRHNLAPGEPLSLHLSGNDIREATLRTPQGDDVELTADATHDGVVFRTSRTILPGDYALEVGLSGDRIPFHVRRDPLESDLTPLTDADHALLAEAAGLSRRAAATDSLHSSVPSDPLWPLLLMLLMGLMLAELLLSGSLSRERFGTDPIAETSERLADDAADLSVFVSRAHRSSANQRNVLTRPRT
ncbi:MAG TPA: BatA domain-containing protein [Planctomycetaceae bacterium]|nr:BatA domain-containing protein [Planctomycetaceae bacterium]